jgi:hypothetical protein
MLDAELRAHYKKQRPNDVRAQLTETALSSHWFVHLWSEDQYKRLLESGTPSKDWKSEDLLIVEKSPDEAAAMLRR